MRLLDMIGAYEADLLAEISELRAERDEWKKKYSDLLDESLKTARLLSTRTLQAALAGAFTPPTVGDVDKAP